MNTSKKDPHKIPCRIPKCGNSIRSVDGTHGIHGQFLCQTHWRMVPGAIKGKLFDARERAKTNTGKTALKAVEAEAKRAVCDAIAKANAQGGAL